MIFKKQLKDVTLLAYSSRDIKGSIASLMKCCEKIDFAEVKLLSHEKPNILPNNIHYEYAPHINNYDDYNYYMFLELGKHVTTSHALVVQYDSCILNPELWNDDWLQYDYGGAPWPLVKNNYIANNGDIVRVGNAGFLLISKKMLDLPKQKGWYLREDRGFKNDDGQFCVYWRSEMLENGIKYMPLDEACIFSHETNIPENSHIEKFFGYHHHGQVLINPEVI
jgi:hypothetical protein